MNVEELIKILTDNIKPEDRKNSEIEIRHGNDEYEIESINKFNIIPDIVIYISPIISSIIKPAKFKKEHTKMVEDKVKDIIKHNGD